ncbi:protein phosphatase 1 regulatory subunit 16A isoform X3 [Episyrphus balteatus]|uniref:protein phosphatase 1 regulatory subunit 16A isoform X3 n=1 Tax=Episyrphus balteatus TaxID=286459 RepID=UPI002485928E|nr:protein phosphatase 1 regulatory subunit 16A isoform X3 [Episyrphus balteatus]
MVKGILVHRPRPDDADKLSALKMDHSDLVAEMQTVENLPTHERLQLARMRRAQQLKINRQKEKEWLKLQRSQKNNHQTDRHSISRQSSKHIFFENSVILLEAASRNDIQEVANLLQRGITPDAANEDGLTALHQCCIDNNIEMLKLLLDYGANVDAQDSDKWTPLHAAATCGHLYLVKILIERGANLLAVNTDGNMPYDLCDDEDTLDFIEAEMSKRGVTQELIDDTRSMTEKQMLSDLLELASNGGDLEDPDHQGATPLHIASANGYNRVVEFLLEHHVNVDAVDKDLWTPVHAAACWGHLEVLEMLAQYGADLNAKNKDDETPSDICEDQEIRERIEQLKSEQETKRLADAQIRRVRRSQSSNTRAQSVRRTSLRDKTLTTKKDAVEETRLRLQAQEVFTTPDSTTEILPTYLRSNLETKQQTGDATNNHDHLPTSTTPTIPPLKIEFRPSNSSNEGGSGDKIPTKTLDSSKKDNNHHITSNNNNVILINGHHGSGSAIEGNELCIDDIDSTAYLSNSRYPPDGKEYDELTGGMDKMKAMTKTSAFSNGNTTNSLEKMSGVGGSGGNNRAATTDTHHVDNAYAGATLANLKKQRSQSRSNALTENGSVIGTNNSTDAASTSSPSSMDLRALSMTKFSGITGDVVGDSTSSRRKCCTLM